LPIDDPPGLRLVGDRIVDRDDQSAGLRKVAVAGEFSAGLGLKLDSTVKGDNERVGEKRILRLQVSTDLADMGQNFRPLVSTDAALIVAVNSLDRGNPWNFLTVDAEHVDAQLSLPNLNCRQAKNMVRIELWGGHRLVLVSDAWGWSG